MDQIIQDMGIADAQHNDSMLLRMDYAHGENMSVSAISNIILDSSIQMSGTNRAQMKHLEKNQQQQQLEGDFPMTNQSEIQQTEL